MSRMDQKEEEIDVLDDILTMEVPGDIDVDEEISKTTSGKKRQEPRISAEESLKKLTTERRQLEKENEDKVRNLELLKMQQKEMEEAAKKECPSKQDDRELEADEYGSDADGSVSCSSSSNSLEDSYETGEESASDENYDENNCDDAASSSASINRRSRSSGVRSSHSNPNKASSAELDDSKARKFTSPLKVKHRVELSPIKWNRSRSPSPCYKEIQRARSPRRSRHCRLPENCRRTQSWENGQNLKYIFTDCRYFLIKSNNHINVELSQAKGVWSTPRTNEARLNQAFRKNGNVILIFSVRESGQFQGFARIASESDPDHPPVQWQLPTGLTTKSLSGVFKIDWICKRGLPFGHTTHIYNIFNMSQPVKVGRDGQEIDPKSGEDLCRLFSADRHINLNYIAQKSRQSLKDRGFFKEMATSKADVHRETRDDEYKLRRRNNGELRTLDRVEDRMKLKRKSDARDLSNKRWYRSNSRSKENEMHRNKLRPRSQERRGARHEQLNHGRLEKSREDENRQKRHRSDSRDYRPDFLRMIDKSLHHKSIPELFPNGSLSEQYPDFQRDHHPLPHRLTSSFGYDEFRPPPPPPPPPPFIFPRRHSHEFIPSDDRSPPSSKRACHRVIDDFRRSAHINERDIRTGRYDRW